MKKKKLAVVFRCTPNYSIQVAQVIHGIEKYSPNLVCDYVVYWTENGENSNQLDVISKLITHYKKNILFKKFDLGDHIKCVDPRFLSRYSEVVFSIFNIFDLLNEYESILALDSDMLVLGNLDQIKNYTPLLYRQARPINSGLNTYHEEFRNKYSPNAGFIFVTDEIPGYQHFTKECYSILDRYHDQIKLTHEEIVLGILFAKNNLRSTDSALQFNYSIAESNAHCKGGLNALIIHYINVSKPWISKDIRQITPQYILNVLEIDSLLKTSFGGNYINGSTFYDAVRENYCIKYNRFLYDKIVNKLPRSIYAHLEIEYSMLRFHSREFSTNLYFEIKYHPVYCNLRGDFESTSKASLISEFEIGFTIANCDKTVSDEIGRLCVDLNLHMDVYLNKVRAYKTIEFSDLSSEFYNLIYLSSVFLKKQNLLMPYDSGR